MNNPIPHCGLFADYTLEEIIEYIQKLPSAERTGAFLTMQFTLNACHNMIKNEGVHHA